MNTSFYKPIVSEAISPFSPKAFSYYKFRYTGNFNERGSKIHKIEVKPRSAGEKVFEGTIFIRDEFWNIAQPGPAYPGWQLSDLHLVQFFAPIQG
ncbi:MAG: DUF5686 family protein [Owenweeksia sp.]|nr:DUF5686 family protein [Owenweeksia sp.]